MMALAAVLTACDLINGPDPLCACDTVTSAGTIIYGEVIDRDGHVVENARVSAHLVGDAPCGAPPATLQPGILNTTGAIGQFRYALGWSFSASKCWAVWASPVSGSAMTASDTALVLATYTTTLSDSSFVQLQLR